MVCPSCGQPNPEGFRFCGACGTELVVRPQRAPEERKQVSVLFADLVGYTSRTDRRDPEDVRRLIEPVHELMRREIARVGGSVEKFIGDGVMAVFGIPQAHEDDPERAVRAALAIRDTVLDLAEHEGSPLAVRIGVNTGEALVQPDRAPDEGERIVADFVNVASRLEGAAPVNGILVGEATFVRTARAIEYEAFEPILAKGKAEPVLAWRAVSARARVGADLRERGRAPLVGRTGEVQLLCDAYARSRRDRTAQLVTLVGPPGIGKSRIVLELSSVLDDDPDLVSWRRGACLPYGDGVEYWPLVEMVKAQTGILETDTADETAEKLGRELAETHASDEEARWVTDHLRRLLGLDRGDARGGTGEAFAAWRRFFEALAERYPLVLVFEDLHWADDGLLDFIDHLVDWATGVPLLVICTARPELLTRRSDWGGGKTNAVTISLSPLSDDETSELVTELLEQAVLPAELTTRLLARAGGNPLYAEEFVRMLAGRDQPGAEGELPIPESVQGIVGARLDTLSPDEKATLQDAAVVGRTFWPTAVAHLAGAPRWAVEERLRALERKQFVQRTRRSTVEGETEFSFRHLLMRDVAYERIPRARRLDQHMLVAQWLESLRRPEEHAETLAHHYAEALSLARAAGRDTAPIAGPARLALADAGDRTFALRSYGAAARLYRTALELTPTDDPGIALLRFRYGRALYWSEEGGADVLEAARDALLDGGDRERAAEAEAMLGRLASSQGRKDESLARLRRAVSLLDDTPVSESKAMVLAAVSKSLLLAAESEAAITTARAVLDMADSLERPDLRADAMIVVADARIELGDLGALGDFEAGLALAEELNSPDCVSGRINLADTLMDLGELSRAAENRALAQRAAERFGEARSLDWLQAEFAGQAYWGGQWDEALAIVDPFIAVSEAGHRHYQEIYCRVTRGRIRLARGELGDAVDDGEKALAFARDAKDPQALYPALAFAARARLAICDRDGSAAAASELLELVRGGTKTPVAFLWMLDLALALDDLGLGPELVGATAKARKPTPWLEAARALGDGRPLAAAEIYARIGARPDEALARSRAARLLHASGRHTEARAEHDRAAAFFASVGAPSTAAAVA